MEDFRPFRQFRKVPFQDFRECVEQAPCRAILELRIGRFSPFFEHLGDHPVGAAPHIGCPDDQVMGRFIPQPVVLVGVDALTLVTPELHQLSHATGDHLGQVPLEMNRVFTSKTNFP